MIQKMYKIYEDKSKQNNPDDPDWIPLDFEMNTILTKEKADKFRKILTKCNTQNEEIIEFFKEVSYQEMMNSSLS